MGDVTLRNSNFNKLKALLKPVKGHTDTPPVLLTYSQAQSNLKMAKTIMDRTEEIQERLLLAAADDAARDIQEAAFFPILSTFYEINWRVQDILNSAANPNSSNNSGSSTNSVAVKLPAIELPTFDGNYSTWLSYKDLFLATVDNNRQLAPAQKLQYLKSSLQGVPANLIRSMAITDANYQEAWKLLDERYSNNREIIESLVNNILNMRPVQNENAHALQSLVDNLMENLRSLEVLKQPVKQWDTLLIAIVLSKVDAGTRKEWAKKQTSTTVPTLKEFTDFASSHIRGLLASTGTAYQPDRKRNIPVRAHHTSSEPTCLICKGSHPHFKCTDLNNKSTGDRIAIVKKLHLCFNCLNKGHGKPDCKSQQRCKKCHQRHHTLLHEERASPHPANKHTARDKSHPPASTHPEVTSHLATANTQVLLSTAVVKIKDVRGQYQPVRIFLDNGSQATLITEECVNRLGIQRHHSSFRVTGISDTNAGTTRGKVIVELHSQWNTADSVEVEAHILPRLTGDLPKYPCQHRRWKHLVGLQLADPEYHQPSKIDILVGADYFGKLILGGRRVCNNTGEAGPDAQSTVFGWILSGRVGITSAYTVSSYAVSTETVHNLMKKFWEVEEPPHSLLLTKEERQCEEHFTRTTTRDPTGRYIVSIPFNHKKAMLGQSRDSAIRRFLQVEKRLTNHPDMKNRYLGFMREYQQLGHMQKVPPSQVHRPDGTAYYLPHHCVINPSSTSTKLRVVFDGSAKSSTNLSLNETMLVGPTVQDDLFDILLRFRTFPVALKADISKMFRQFQLVPSDTDFHRIIWRESPDEPLEDYRLLTVTYGTSCAPYLATRCLKQLGLDSAEKYPKASTAIIRDSYVDDLMSGDITDETTIDLYRQLTRATEEGQMDLRKWSSSSATVLSAIPESHRETNPHDFDPEQTVKALGVQWTPTTDLFTFKYIEPQQSSTLTKRKLLSDLAKVYDPLGLISPIIIRAKLLLQELWKLNMDWDQPVPIHIQQQWLDYQEDLKQISQIIIPRRITTSQIAIQGNTTQTYQIHGFSDASELAYGAVVYLRTTTTDQIQARMITSKTRVCPLRQITLPRLELMAAVLLAELVDHLVHILNLNCEVFLYTDSTITLKWITSPPRRWKTFVANRVARIQECSNVESWRHVPGTNNPADLASRGTTVTTLKSFSLWWNGPSWLSEPILPTFLIPENNTDNIEERQASFDSPTIPVVTYSTTVDMNIMERFSSLTRLKRVTAYTLRFIYNSRPQNRSGKLTKPLSPTELQQSFLLWIKIVQKAHFSDDLSSLRKDGRVKSSSKLSSLNPYVDSQGVLRVAGRLRHAQLPEHRKHQAILPGNSHFTQLIIHHHHQLQFHSGFQLTWAAIQAEFWILRGRDRVRHHIRSCVVCRRYRGKAANQLMGDLPSCRITPTRPFLHTGVDYAGPFNLKNPIGRAPKIYKGYLGVFVCMATKAIHLEAVSSLSTPAFIATLRRFVSRRGLCAHIYCDNGKNFVGAERELGMLLKSTQTNQAIADHLSSNGIKWHYNAPLSPHQGGLWEAGVKSAKFHLRRVMGDANLTYEQFSTILCQIEAILNSRPLYQSSSDPTDFMALTPGHFLIGEPLLSIPDVDLTNSPKNRLDAFQLQQQRIQYFWRRWSREYLNTLQQRNKWKWERDNIQVGELVLLIDDNLPPGKWNMGRVVEVHMGGDGKVRDVIVKTATSQFRRSICKLIPLVVNEPC